jgi:hypothetical protein
MHSTNAMFGSSAKKERTHLFSVPRDAKRKERKDSHVRAMNERDSHSSGTRVTAGVVGLGLLWFGVENRHSLLGRVALGVGVAAIECAVTGYFPSVIRTVGLARAA